MRFSDTLRLSANPAWWRYYLPYEDLKKTLARLRYLRHVNFDTHHSRAPSRHEESSDEDRPTESPRISRTASQRVLLDLSTSSPLSASGHTPSHADPSTLDENEDEDDLFPLFPTVSSAQEATALFASEEARFFRQLRRRAHRADTFFTRLCGELHTAAGEKRVKADWIKRRDDTQAVVEGTPLIAPPGTADDVFPHGEAAAFKTEFITFYREIHDALNFSELNLEAFRKILKKHDKWMAMSTMHLFLDELDNTTALSDTSSLKHLHADAVNVFADVFADGDVDAAREELDYNLRDLVLFERNSIWRNDVDNNPKASPRAVKGFRTLKDEKRHPSQRTFKPAPVLIAILLTLFIKSMPVVLRSIVGSDAVGEFSSEVFNAANRCFALVILSVTLWATVGIPLFATAFIVFLGCVLGSVFLDDEGVALTAVAASNYVFQELGSPTLLLILSVYALAAALSKFEIDKQIATVVLSKVRRADAVLAMLMVISVCVSLIVSNVAAPVLLISVLRPTFDMMETKKAPRKYVECLLLGIMVSCNIGGFVSPIASPQSAVAVGLLTGEHRISFAQWLVVGVPVCGVMVCAFFVVLRIMFGPQRYVLPELAEAKVEYGWWHWGTVLTLVTSSIIWFDQQFVGVFGSTGMEAVVPLVLLFGSGILSKSDFVALPWDVVMLVAGGSVLGAAVQSSQLLDLLSQRLLSLSSLGLWPTFVTLCAVVAVVASFVSHTVSAIILLPLFLRVGESLGHAQMFVLGGTFAASCAMATNVSSFPNISVSEVQDSAKEPYITSARILVVGSAMTLIAVAVLSSVGFLLMSSSIT